MVDYPVFPTPRSSSIESIGPYDAEDHSLVATYLKGHTSYKYEAHALASPITSEVYLRRRRSSVDRWLATRGRGESALATLKPQCTSSDLPGAFSGECTDFVKFSLFYLDYSHQDCGKIGIP